MAWDVAPCMIKESETPDEKRERKFSTPDLVQELCSREGIRIKHVMQPEKYEIRVYRDHEFMESSGKYDGPARIIVIRGDE